MTNREEVAARLRMYATDFDFGDSNPLWYVEKAVFDDIRIRESGRVFARLADIIDPTCHIVETVEDGETMYVCSNCYSCKSDDKDIFSKFNYCPVCGARVVRDDL